MLINMVNMLEIAQRNKFAVGAFNVSDNALLQSVVESAEENNSPAIIAVHPTELAYGKDEFFKYVATRLANSKIPFVLHLDHGDNLSSVLRAIRCGFSSIMIDGSSLPFEENLSLTKSVVNICHLLDISVEGELGTIGSMGTTMEEGVEGITYTNPKDAKYFVESTNVDTLAVAIGTAHGIYPKGFIPNLKMNILQEIAREVTIPLVLHGGSNNPDSEIIEAIRLGICKVNISSDYKREMYQKLRKVLQENEGWDPNNIFPECIKEAKKVVKEKMILFHSIDKASLYLTVSAWRCELL